MVAVTTLKDWYYKQATQSTWRPARPGLSCTEIHPDLLHNGEIPDPFIDDNEKLVQWVSDQDWEYKTTFIVDDLSTWPHHDLKFEGLDTFADVYLNGHNVLTTTSMFVEHVVKVGPYLKGGENELRIYFHSSLLKGRELETLYGKHGCFNGETSRMQIRKAQYHYGWDWGPLLNTCGPYRPITLISYRSCIHDVYVHVDINDDLSADLDMQVDIFIDDNHEVLLEIDIESPHGEKFRVHDTINNTGKVSRKLTLSNPDLWYPFSHGNPSLYTFTFTISHNNHILQSMCKNIGLRKVELVQEPFDDQPGTSFYFKVNHIPVYCNGSDWIPAHSFQTCLTEQDYTDWMNLMVDGNQNMLRIWGGGYYEQDILYQQCDKLGILIWHDLMFACGQYPGHLQFVALVEQELICQFKRLRNYCSIVLYAGNNEDYQCAEKLNLTWDKSDISGDYSNTNFPARTLYENVFPRLVAEYCYDLPYHPGSPWGGSSTEDPTIGDIHQWNVWHGTQEKYQNWYKLGGRFVSEFGMEGLPNIKTYHDCITKPEQLYPQSYLVDHHNKSDGYERRLALYVMENIKVEGMDLANWIYATQLMQAECLGYAYRCWRREWRGDGKRYSGGTLVWQINDCWPCASWAIVDYYKRPKLAYYSVKRESKPLGVGIYRNQEREDSEFRKSSLKESAPFDYSQIHYNVDIWGVNSSIKDVEAILKVDLYDVTSGELLTSLDNETVILKANQTTEFISKVNLPDNLPVVVYARIVSTKDHSIIASAGDWPQPLKFLYFPKREITIEVENDLINLSTNKPVKGVEISLEEELYIEDNGFDLFPNDVKTVNIKGLNKDSKVTVRYYR